MANEGSSSVVAGVQPSDRRPCSIFEVAIDFFDSCRLIAPGKHLPPATLPQSQPPSDNSEETLGSGESEKIDSTTNRNSRWSCNTCKVEFESLIEQRFHFKSDFHRFNVKLSVARKKIMKEEDFDDFTSDSFSKEFDDVSSISGSEDEDEKESLVGNIVKEALVRNLKQKIYVHLPSGERVFLWKCLLLKDSQVISYEHDQFVVYDDNGRGPSSSEVNVVEKLKSLIHEPRNSTHLRVMLLAKGGHFAGCVFDGNTVVAQKTFHRYVVRAKAGKRQSAKDASGKSIHSAGASLRRYNELALKKDIQELLTSWKPYFSASSCVYIHAPSNNRQVFYIGEKPLFSDWCSDTRNIPCPVRRPTLKEAQRIYGQLTQVVLQEEVERELPGIQQLELNESCEIKGGPVKESKRDDLNTDKAAEACGRDKVSDDQSISSESDKEVVQPTTPLHEATKSNDAEKVLELLAHGLDPTIKDDRGRTPYMVATDKEVRNTFRRFMALNLEKWDWHAANVPSPLTKEMEESQAAKQAEKDAKKKAKAKELKKQRKEREKKKAEAEAAESTKVTVPRENKNPTSLSVRQVLSGAPVKLSKEEDLKRKQVEEREKRAAAAERRMTLLAAASSASSSSSPSQGDNKSATPNISQLKSGVSSDSICSCCSASLAGKVPFHRYTYKYCSTTCMHVHREILENE